jgi:hypothetical protein
VKPKSKQDTSQGNIESHLSRNAPLTRKRTQNTMQVNYGIKLQKQGTKHNLIKHHVLQVPIFVILWEIHKFPHHKPRLPHSPVEFVLLKMAQVSFQSVPKSHTVPEASELRAVPLSSWQEIRVLILLQPRRSSQPQILDPLEECLWSGTQPMVIAVNEAGPKAGCRQPH